MKNANKATLTAHGKLVAQRLKESKEENIERNNGTYVPDVWYRPLLSEDFEIPEQSGDMNASNYTPTDDRKSSRKSKSKKSDEEFAEESYVDADEYDTENDEESYD